MAKKAKKEVIQKIDKVDFIESYGDTVDFMTARYLSSRRKTKTFLELYVLLGADFFTFMSIFAGKSIKFPKLSVVRKMQRDLNVCFDYGKMTLEDMTKKYGLRKAAVLSIKRKIDRNLASYDILDEEIEDGRFQESYRTYKKFTRS